MQSSRPRPLYLGFSSQKGGVGKSTLAEILSSMLYYEEGISLFVVDCDLTQDSFFKLREREKGTIGEDPALTTYMQAYFHKLQRRSYRINSVLRVLLGIATLVYRRSFGTRCLTSHNSLAINLYLIRLLQVS